MVPCLKTLFWLGCNLADRLISGFAALWNKLENLTALL